jgi:hypothetical protein
LQGVPVPPPPSPLAHQFANLVLVRVAVPRHRPAPRRLRVYTRTGDKGQSSLYNGSRADKSSAVFAALGDTDEVNASVGLALEHCKLLAEKCVLF